MAATRDHDVNAEATDTNVPVYWKVRSAYRRFARTVGHSMPTGLYARSLLIIVMPVVLLQALVAFVFMERHYQTVTARLSILSRHIRRIPIIHRSSASPANALA